MIEARPSVVANAGRHRERFQGKPRSGHEAFSHQVSSAKHAAGRLASRYRGIHRDARRRSGAAGKNLVLLHEEPRRLRLLSPRHRRGRTGVKALQQHPSFSRYTDKTRAAAGGAVDVLPLEVVAETKWRA
jgi:hypothetical protein